MLSVFILLASTALAQTTPPPTPARDVMRAAIEKQKAAAAKQLESIRKQAENVGVWLTPGAHPDAIEPLAAHELDPQVQPPCDPLTDEALTPMIDTAAKTQDLETNLLRAVIEQESAYRPCAVSAKGAQGLMQLMPDTALELGVKDALDPRENIAAGAKYLKQLLEKYKGDLPQALGAYNAGPTAVDQAGGIPDIRETRDYVNSILQKLAPKRTDPPSIPTPKPIEN